MATRVEIDPTDTWPLWRLKVDRAESAPSAGDQIEADFWLVSATRNTDLPAEFMEAFAEALESIDGAAHVSLDRLPNPTSTMSVVDWDAS